MGIFNSGAALGAVSAPIIITPIASAYGWRWAFLVIGLLGFVWIILWLGFTGAGRCKAFAIDRATRPPARSARDILRPFGTILSHPGFWLLILVSITINPCWYFCCDWIPGYLKEQSGLPFLRAGLLSTFVFLGGDIGNYVGGGCIKFLAHRNWPVPRARAITVASGASLASCMAIVPHLQSTVAIIGLLAVAGLGINMISPIQTACQTEVSHANTAQLAGLSGLAANIFAALINPRIGRYVDTTRHYDLIFYLVALSPWISAGAIMLFDRLIERRRKTGFGHF
jgi:ACS family hexuronate transporter-like MFS transporter